MYVSFAQQGHEYIKGINQTLQEYPPAGIARRCRNSDTP